jgi:hypothetical protein
LSLEINHFSSRGRNGTPHDVRRCAEPSAHSSASCTPNFHRHEHLSGWKTLLPSLHDETAVVDYLRSPRPVYLVRLEHSVAELAA